MRKNLEKQLRDSVMRALQINDMAIGFKQNVIFKMKADESDRCSDSPAGSALLEDMG